MNPISAPALLVGNWKMNGTKSSIDALLKELLEQLSFYNKQISSNKLTKVVLCPPAVYLSQVAAFLERSENKQVVLGAQNVYYESSGAFTGEVSPNMLVDIGCRYVLIGHSERRQLLGENDALIAKKAIAAYHAGLIPIICVGESTKERQAGMTLEVVKNQLNLIVSEPSFRDLTRIVIAYEPVWAIGTGLSATPKEAAVVHAFIRECFKKGANSVEKSVRILYGGSVKPENAGALSLEPNMNGVLVGGASLKAKEFIEIYQAFNY